MQRFAEDLVLEGSFTPSEKHIMCDNPPVGARIANDLVWFGSSQLIIVRPMFGPETF